MDGLPLEECGLDRYFFRGVREANVERANICGYTHSRYSYSEVKSARYFRLNVEKNSIISERVSELH